MNLIKNLLILLFASLGLIHQIIPVRVAPPSIPVKVSLPKAKNIPHNIGGTPTIGIMTIVSATGTILYNFSNAVPVTRSIYSCDKNTIIQKKFISTANIYYLSSGQISDTAGETIGLSIYDTTNPDTVLLSMSCGGSCTNSAGKTVILAQCP